jgi:3',5'-cyclic-AMP phosphodiesterase
MIVMHHPPRSPSTHPWFQLRGADELMDALGRRPHVRLIASGHLHEDIDITEGAVRIRGAPSTLYAIKHEGRAYALVDGGLVGAQLFVLDDDGGFSCACVPRSWA